MRRLALALIASLALLPAPAQARTVEERAAVALAAMGRIEAELAVFEGAVATASYRESSDAQRLYLSLVARIAPDVATVEAALDEGAHPTSLATRTRAEALHALAQVGYRASQGLYYGSLALTLPARAIAFLSFCSSALLLVGGGPNEAIALILIAAGSALAAEGIDEALTFASRRGYVPFMENDVICEFNRYVHSTGPSAAVKAAHDAVQQARNPSAVPLPDTCLTAWAGLAQRLKAAACAADLEAVRDEEAQVEEEVQGEGRRPPAVAVVGRR